MTPTQRTMKELKQRGYKTAIVEKWNQNAFRPDGHRGVRQDMFGIIDIIALDFKEKRILGVQSTGSGFSEHLKALKGEKAQACIDWLRVGGHLELWGWRKLKVKRGGKQMKWTPRLQILTLKDFYDI